MFFCDVLTALRVPHTAEYSCKRFNSMPFKSMFGMQSLLREYGVTSLAVNVGDHSEVSQLPLPFVAPVKAHEWVIVTGVDNGKVDYISQGQHESVSAATFDDAWTGNALLMRADSGAAEPHYRAHRFTEIMTGLRNLGLWLCAVALLVFCLVTNGLYDKVWAYFLILFNIQGLVASYMLVQKTVGIHTKAAQAVCGAIEKEGCDNVIKVGGTFLGIFHWSEVGFAYFGVSLIVLLTAPQALPWLAIFNICCLPYTLWSVTYQKFVAKSWCTLCLTVQATLWILFATYLFSGWWHNLSWSATPFVLLACYVGVTCALNKLLPMINVKTNGDDNH